MAAAAAGGDSAALGALFDRYNETVYRYCHSKLRSRESAEDAAADVWMTVLKRLPTYEFFPRSHGFVGWLFTIARSRVVDSTRVTSRRRELSVGFTTDMLEWADLAGSTLSGPEEAAVAQDTAERVTKLVQSLPDRQAHVLTARFFLGLSLNETSDLLRVSVGAVKLAQHRGLKSLRAAHLPAARNLLG